MSKKIVKVEWLLVTQDGTPICVEETLYDAIRTRDAVPELSIQIQVTIVEMRDPTHAEMAESLGLPDWSDAVSGGGN
jgi:hypothetical protein